MKKHYDATKHISAHDLAVMLGVTHSQAAAKARRAGIKSAGRVRAGGNLITVFDRKEATEWAQSLVVERTNVTPAADWNLMQRKPWTPKGRLADNFARAGEVYPHALRSQGKCIGNGVEGIHGFGRGC
ncbi:hypothetical protein G5B41_17695 [bacterium SGD-2]|nr:hypothetical protein [bacterium SGD-2]